MGQLAAFLTSPAVAPGTPAPPSAPQIAFATPDVTTPELAGIFRIFHPEADPVATPQADTATAAAVPLPQPPPGAGDRALRGRNHHPGGCPPLTAGCRCKPFTRRKKRRDNEFAAYCRLRPALL